MKRGFLTSKKLQATKLENAQRVKIKIPTGSPLPPASGPSIDLTSLKIPGADGSTLNWNVVTLPRPPLTPYALCVLFEGTKDAILSTPGFPVPFYQDFWPLSYEIRTSNGAGLGVFATKDITPGENIIVERPLYVMPQIIPARSREEGEGFVQNVVENYMDAGFRNALLALHNCKGSDRSRIMGIIDTNSLPIDKLPGPYEGVYGAVCENISRVNHSCSPNAFCRFDLLSFTFALRALTAIPAGTEITISYLSSTLLPYTSRQSELRNKYTFKCTCTTCSLPKAQRAQSNARREVLRRHTESVNIAVDERELRSHVLESDSPIELLVKKSLAVMGMMEREGLNEPEIWPVHTQRLVKTYAAFGDAVNAQTWARRATELTCAFTGTDGGWGAIEKDIKQTDWWGLRAGAT